MYYGCWGGNLTCEGISQSQKHLESNLTSHRIGACTIMRGCIKGATTHVNSINSRAVGVWDLEDVV